MEDRQPNNPQPSSSFLVSGRQQKTDYTKVNDKLEEFVKCFVKEFEATLHAYHLFSEGIIEKAGKFSDTFSEIVGQGVGGAIGALIGLPVGLSKEGSKVGAEAGEKVGKKVGEWAGNLNHGKEVTKLLELIDLFQKDKTYFRSILVEAGFDVFQSYEMQFMRVTTDEKPRAIRYLARDATNRALNYMKNNKDISISESVILGESKREAVYSVSPGWKIQYKFQSNEMVWNTASLFDKAGIVIENAPSRYYKKKNGLSNTNKYGYRRLLVHESWNKLKDDYDYDNLVESKSGQFTDYQYLVSLGNRSNQINKILRNINGQDPNLEENRIKEILKEVKQDILSEIDVLKTQDQGLKEKLKSIEDYFKNLTVEEYLKNFKIYFEEAKQELQKITHSIEEGREENRETQKILSEIKLAILPPQETRTEGIISGLGITKYYYMSRTLNRRIQIKHDFKNETLTFFVTRSSSFDNSTLQKNQNIVIISNTDDDFKRLCVKYEDYNIHWLKEEKEGKFIWQYSQGSLSELRRFVDNKDVEISEVEKIGDIKDKVVIISAGPGMGKSTLLTYLAAEQNKVSSTIRIIRVNLNDHTAKVSEADFKKTSETIEFLKEIIGITDIPENSILLLDGFDEISSNKDLKRKVIKLIVDLKNDEKNVWVTTRPNAQCDLEDKLSVFSYTLEPLSKEKQEELLEKFWKTNFIYDMIKEFTLKIQGEIEDKEIKSLAGQVSKVIGLENVEIKGDDDYLNQIKRLFSKFDLSKKGEVIQDITVLLDKQLGKKHKTSKKVKDIVEKVSNTPNFEKINDLIHARAKSYAEELIAKFSQSVSDKEREFTGVPLQVRMLAEAFQEEFYEDFKNYCDIEPTERGLEKPKLPAGLNLLDLYERFIESKYMINFTEKGNMDLTNGFIKTLYNNSREPFMKEHRLLALSLLFSEEELNKIIVMEEKLKINTFKEDIEVGKKNTGIVYQIIKGKPHFIHRTFAEYFAADFFVNILKEQKDQVRDFLREYIFKAENAVIRNFFDRMLTHDKENKNQYEIHTAVLNNDGNKINTLLSDIQKAEHIINSIDKGERTTLHLAAAYGYSDIVEALLEHHVKIKINTKDQIFGWSPLSYADKNCYWYIAELLLQRGASGDDMFEAKRNVNTSYKGKRTLLHIAAQKGYIEFAKVLVEKLEADYRAADNYNNTPLHLAACFGELEIVEYLLNKDIETACCKDYSGKTPLDLAVYRGQLEVVEYLGKKLCLETKELNEMKLNAAASNGDYEMVTTLLKENVDINSKVLGWTPLHQAAQDGNLKVVQLLVENGSKISHLGDGHPNPNVRDGWTPLHGAANNGHYDIVKYLVEKLLLENNADINPANNEGYTPLHSAARGGHLRVVKYYIEELGQNKVDINVSDRKGTTPLHAAAFHGKYNIVQYLVEKDADINAIDTWGATVVFSAACFNDHQIINFLLEKNAKIDIELKERVIGRLGITVLHVAAMYGASEIVKRLVEEKNIDVNAEESSFTPLHLAALSDSLTTIKYLINNSINKDAKVNAFVNFSNIAKVLKDEEQVFKDTSMNTVVQKLIKITSFLGYLVNVTPCDIYKILKYKNKESLALLEQEHGLLNKIKIASAGFIGEQYFTKQINELKKFIGEKKSGDLYLLEQHLLDPPDFKQLNNLNKDSTTRTVLFISLLFFYFFRIVHDCFQ